MRINSVTLNNQNKTLNSTFKQKQKLNYGINYLSDKTNTPKIREKKDYDYLREGILETALLAFCPAFGGITMLSCNDIMKNVTISNGVSKKVVQATPLKDKILFGLLAAAMLWTVIATAIGIRHYIQDKKNGLV